MAETSDSRPINVFILSESGKPVFVRHGEVAETARICGILKAIKLSCQSEIGNIQNIFSSRRCISFMEVQSLTLVAVAETDHPQQTQAYSKLLLEYCYAQLISTLTDNVLSGTQHDLSRLIDDGSLRQMLDDWEADPSVFLSSGIASVVIDPHLRQLTSDVLQQNVTCQTLYGLIIVNEKILALVQPNAREFLLHGSDLILLVRCVGKRKERELWFPICLPRFRSSGTFHCYSYTLDEKTRTTLALVTQDSSNEEFRRMQSAAKATERALGISTIEMPTVEQKASLDSPNGSDDDFVNVSEDGNERMVSINERGSSDIMPFQIGLLSVESAYYSKQRDYLEAFDDMIHFLFRFDARVVTKTRQLGHLTQNFSSGDPKRAFDARIIWRLYHQLSLRLRLGSATTESIQDTFDVVSKDMTPTNGGLPTGIAAVSPAMVLAEATPSIHTISYSSVNEITCVAMNGEDFELYLTMPAKVPVKDVVSQGARLARMITLDQTEVFLARPAVLK